MGEWVSVERRLPPVDRDVLVAMPDGVIIVANRPGYDYFFTPRNERVKPTHWRPLPPPPGIADR